MARARSTTGSTGREAVANIVDVGKQALELAVEGMRLFRDFIRGDITGEEFDKKWDDLEARMKAAFDDSGLGDKLEDTEEDEAKSATSEESVQDDD